MKLYIILLIHIVEVMIFNFLIELFISLGVTQVAVEEKNHS